MDNAVLVYRVDNWHSVKSRDIIGVCTSSLHVIKTIEASIDKAGDVKLCKEQEFNILSYNQTQGYQGEGEFHIEVVEVNTLL